MDGLTKKISGDALRKSILFFIESYKKANGFPPSYREIAAYFNISLSSVAYHIQKLIESGSLKKNPKRARTTNLPNTLPIQGVIGKSGIRRIPPLYFIKTEGSFSKNAYCLIVEGNDFIDKLIKEGDILVIDKKPEDGKNYFFVKQSGSGILIEKTTRHDDFVIGVIRCLIRAVEYHHVISRIANSL